jgi:hypothetical protein
MLGICIRLAAPDTPDTALQYHSLLHCWTSQGWGPTFFAELMRSIEQQLALTFYLIILSLWYWCVNFVVPKDSTTAPTFTPHDLLYRQNIYPLPIAHVLDFSSWHLLRVVLRVAPYSIPQILQSWFVWWGCSDFKRRRPPPCGWRRSCSSLNNPQSQQSVLDSATKAESRLPLSIC